MTTQTKVTLTAKQEVLFNQQKKSMAITYLLWLFLGGFGAQYFYIKRPELGAGVIGAMIVCMIGFYPAYFYVAVVMVGAVFSYTLTNEYNEKLKSDIVTLTTEDVK